MAKKKKGMDKEDLEEKKNGSSNVFYD